MSINTKTLAVAVLLPVAMAALVQAHAADYSYQGAAAPEYYRSTNYEDRYGTQFNYGYRAKNISDFMTPELPYGVTSNTSVGAMEKTGMPSQTVSFGGYSIDTGGIPAAVAEVNGAKTITPNVTVTLSPTTNPTPAPTQTITVYQKTAYTDVSDMVRSDGSIGTLKIPSLGINMKVWEGETDSSMAKGIAHYSSTSGWDGNICLCGHNRGTKYAIGSIKNLRTGDTITYTTVYGTRTYEVSYVGTIANTDWSRLQATQDNRITITTCLADQPSKRVVVQAIEK